MYILDTNVISELMKEQPDKGVILWISSHNATELYTSVIAQAEIGYGIARLATGGRKTALQNAFKEIFGKVFSPERILPFDSDAARSYSIIVASREHHGRPVSVLDAQTAAICMNSNATLVTRNVKDFDLIEGLILLNPWGSGDSTI